MLGSVPSAAPGVAIHQSCGPNRLCFCSAAATWATAAAASVASAQQQQPRRSILLQGISGSSPGILLRAGSPAAAGLLAVSQHAPDQFCPDAMLPAAADPQPAPLMLKTNPQPSTSNQQPVRCWPQPARARCWPLHAPHHRRVRPGPIFRAAAPRHAARTSLGLTRPWACRPWPCRPWALLQRSTAGNGKSDRLSSHQTIRQVILKSSPRAHLPFRVISRTN